MADARGRGAGPSYVSSRRNARSACRRPREQEYSSRTGEPERNVCARRTEGAGERLEARRMRRMNTPREDHRESATKAGPDHDPAVGGSSFGLIRCAVMSKPASGYRRSGLRVTQALR